MTQDPILLKPGNVSNLPAQRIKDTQERADQLLVIQICYQGECTLPNFLKEVNALDYSRAGLHKA